MTPATPTVRRYPPKPTDVYLFATCLIDQFAPEAGLDTVRLLEREGITVHFPVAQTCCGQPVWNMGARAGAVTAARHLLRVMREGGASTTSQTLPSCAWSMRSACGEVNEKDCTVPARVTSLLES